MMKNLLVIGLTLASVSAFASADMVKMTPEKFVTYQKGILEMFRTAYNANSGECDANAANRTLSVLNYANEAYMDANSAQPVVVFVQNPTASREGEMKITLSIHTTPNFKGIASTTIERTMYRNQLVNSDIRNLQYGIVPVTDTQTCVLGSATNPTNPTNPTK